jgi:leucine dehydrogenase
MTYKSAIANLPLGGGKSVIIGDPRADKSEALLQAFGRFLNSLGGRYIAAEDSGTGVSDLQIIGRVTDHVAGIVEKQAADGATRSGDPSPATAYGTFVGIKAAAKDAMGRDDLGGLKVAIQGVGNVGFRVGKYLKEAGAKLWVSDIFADNVRRAVDELDATEVPADDVLSLAVDVLVPCALGAVINDKSVAQLQARIVAGAANNQLAEDRHGEELMKRGIVYAPDYVINAGGIIDIYYEREGHDREKLLHHLEGIGDTLAEIFARSRAEGKPTSHVADTIAQERFRDPKGHV